MPGGLIRTILLLCAMAAMGLRAAAAPGYMLSGDTGRVAITLCNGAAATLDLGKSDHGKPARGEAPCVFAAIAHASAPPTAASLPLINAAFVTTAAAAPARVGRGLAAPPPPSTGPPLSA
jgi:hypothetical protein